jgi:hypothetical protein
MQVLVRIRMGVAILNFNAFWNLYISSFQLTSRLKNKIFFNITGTRNSEGIIAHSGESVINYE